MRLGIILLEAGVDLELGRLPAEQRRHDRTQQHNEEAVVKHRAFETVDGMPVEVARVATTGIERGGRPCLPDVSTRTPRSDQQRGHFPPAGTTPKAGTP